MHNLGNEYNILIWWLFSCSIKYTFPLLEFGFAVITIKINHISLNYAKQIKCGFIWLIMEMYYYVFGYINYHFFVKRNWHTIMVS